MAKEIRNNERLMVDDPEMAVKLFERAKPFLVPEWFGWEVLGFSNPKTATTAMTRYSASPCTRMVTAREMSTSAASSPS